MEYVELDTPSGRKRLRYSWRAIRWLEEQTGQTFQELFESLGTQVSAYTISLLVAGALYEENRDVTIDDGDDLIEEIGLSAAMDAVQRAIEQSAVVRGANVEGASDGDIPKLHATTGKSSRKQAGG